MSRDIEELVDGRYKTVCLSEEDCAWLYDDVCCCDKSDCCGTWPDLEGGCEKCPYFKRETMKKGEVKISGKKWSERNRGWKLGR